MSSQYAFHLAPRKPVSGFQPMDSVAPPSASTQIHIVVNLCGQSGDLRILRKMCRHISAPQSRIAVSIEETSELNARAPVVHIHEVIEEPVHSFRLQSVQHKIERRLHTSRDGGARLVSRADRRCTAPSIRSPSTQYLIPFAYHCPRQAHGLSPCPVVGSACSQKKRIQPSRFPQAVGRPSRGTRLPAPWEKVDRVSLRHPKGKNAQPGSVEMAAILHSCTSRCRLVRSIFKVPLLASYWKEILVNLDA